MDTLAATATAISTGLLGLRRVRISTTTSVHLAIAASTRASGTIVFTGLPANNQTVTVNGTTITFKTSGAVGNQVNIAADAAAMGTALYEFLAASADVNLVEATYEDDGAGTVTVTAVDYGTAGNAITLAESAANTAVSGANLTGGGPIATTSDLILPRFCTEIFNIDSEDGIGVLRVSADGVVTIRQES